jgi:tetratricopeptide (TPR) repeat protein
MEVTRLCSVMLFTVALNSHAADVQLMKKLALATEQSKSLSESYTKLMDLKSNALQSGKEEKALFYRQMSKILFEAGYPRLGVAQLAEAQSSLGSTRPKWMDSIYVEAFNASKKVDLDILLLEVDYPLDFNPAGFGKNWNYIRGLSYEQQGKISEAKQSFSSVDQNSWNFPKALFHRTILEVSEDDFESAKKNLRSLLIRLDLRQGALYPESVKSKLRNEAWLNLGRIFYESSKFDDAIKAYRNVERKTPYYSDALFESAWALFMGGYPNHALGSIYSLSSPWYAGRYKPEADMLESIIYFWLCDYNASRLSLANFLTKHQKTISGLKSFLANRNPDPKNAWEIFDNFVTGVSSESIGIDRKLVAEAIYQESVVPFREHLAGLFEEKSKLYKKGIKGNKNTEELDSILNSKIESGKILLGKQLIRELKVIDADFDRLREHAELLYVELLTSEKDKLLGKELFEESKIKNSETKKPSFWTIGVKQTWAASDKDEYWSDEIGFYVFREKSMCMDTRKE